MRSIAIEKYQKMQIQIKRHKYPDGSYTKQQKQYASDEYKLK